MLAARRVGRGLATLALAGSLVAAGTSCRHESSVHSESAVVEAFGKQQIALTEVLRPTDTDNPIEVILGPEPQASCDDTELRVNVFESEEAVDAHLRTSGQPVGEERYVVRDTVGFVRVNVIAATGRASTCFPEAKVKAALDELP